MKHPRRPLMASLLAAASLACAGTANVQRASVLEFLYPQGSAALPPEDVRLPRATSTPRR